MAKGLDHFVDQLQRQLHEEARREYGEEVFNRWLESKCFGKMANADSSARVTGSCGETIEIYLKIRDDCIREASFYTDGCSYSVACGSVAAELAVDKSFDEAVLIGDDRIAETLGGLPEDHRHCALLAAEALQTAIHNYLVKYPSGKKDPL